MSQPSCLRTLAAALVLAALPTLATPTVANAGHVSKEGTTLVLRGNPGERNFFSVRNDGWTAGHVLFGDRSSNDVTADAAAGCTLGGSGFVQTAVCPTAGIRAIRIEGGDSNDELRISEDDFPLPPGSVTFDGGPGDDDIGGPTTDWPITQFGGDGNDTIVGGWGNDTITGGPGNDKLDGNNGDDALYGGDGDDTVVGGRTWSADLIDGGPGNDTNAGDWSDGTSTQDHLINVTFDGVANDGRPGEGDNVLSIETISTTRIATLIAGDGADAPVTFKVWNTAAGGSRLVGTRFADNLRTDHYDDAIEGGAGGDAIDAGYGNDTINPGPGPDVVLADGGPNACDALDCPIPHGNDTIDARDGERDSIDCGPGSDTILADAIDVLSGCEVVNGVAGGGGAPGNQPNGGGEPNGGGQAPACRLPKIKAGATLKSTKNRIPKACTTVKTKRVKSKKIKAGRVVKLTRKGTTITVHISRGRR